MAEDCCLAIYGTICKCIGTGYLDSSTKDQLIYARAKLVNLVHPLGILEKDCPENSIVTQLAPLLGEAYDGYSEILALLNDQAGLTSDSITMITKMLQMITPDIIAERIEALNPSRSSSQLITGVEVLFVNHCLISISYLAGIDQSHPISLKLCNLSNILLFTAGQFPKHEKWKDLFILAEDVAYTALQLSVLCWETRDHYLARPSVSRDKTHCVIAGPDFEPKFAVLMERINPIRPEVRQLYITLLKAAYQKAPMESGCLASSYVKCSLEELLSLNSCSEVAFSDQFQWLLHGLDVLHDLYEGSLKELDPLLHPFLGPLVVDTAVTVYSLYGVDLEKTTEVDHMLLPLRVKFNHLNLEISLYQTLRSDKTLIGYFQGDLTFFRTFLMDSSEDCKELSNITDILTLVQSATAEAGSIINSLSHDIKELLEQKEKKGGKGAKKEEEEDEEEEDDEEEVEAEDEEEEEEEEEEEQEEEEEEEQEEGFSDKGELVRLVNLSHFQLLLMYKFYEAVIRQMCPIISASSTREHPVVNLLKILPTNFEAIDSYFTMLKSSKKSSSFDAVNMYEVFMGLHEHILEYLLLKDEADLKISDKDKAKKFYHGLLVLVTFLVDPPFQYIECKKQNELLGEIGTLAIEAEAAIRVSYEDALDSSISRKVSLLLQLLTVSFKLIKCEGKLTDLLKHKATFKAGFLDLVENAHEELILLRAFLVDLLRKHTELDKLGELIMHAEVAAHKATLISSCSYECFMDGSSIEKISDFLLEIESVKVDVREVCFQILDASLCNMVLTDVEGLIKFLLSQMDMFLDSDAGSISFLKNRITAIKEKLVYLGHFLEDIMHYHNRNQELHDLVKRVQDFEHGTKYVCFFSVGGYRPTWYYMLHLSDVEQLLKFVEAEVEVIVLKVPDSSSYIFPTTNGIGFLNCFMGKLEELLCSKLVSIVELKHQIRSVKEGLLCLTDHYDEVYGLMLSVTEMAYMAELVVDACLASSHPLRYKVLWISMVVKNIEHVNEVVSETRGRKKIDAETFLKVERTSTYLDRSLSANNPRSNEEMEGFQEAMDQIKNQLTGGSSQLDVISLVGMPGIGKTTLAEKIFNDPIVISHFDVRAQCRVTQVYSVRELLLTILNGFLEPANRNEKEDGELANELRQFLFTKRFLILIDDVWDNDVWDNLKMCFGGPPRGSRIILTTRLSDVAAQCESKPHHLRLLRDEESWKLLQKEVYQGESCPPELVDVGFRVAKCCGGLPLFIVLVAGILKEKKNKAELWKEIEESLGSENIGRFEESISMIEFSYKNLPHQLKPCFLYFGGLLKGRDVHVSKLTRMWVAEGFVQSNNEKGPEDAAQRLLEDLISRNLVMNVEQRPNGKLKTCRIHDLLHKFCLEKAEQENFLLRINGFSGEDAFPEKPKEYRLFVHSSEDQIDLWQPSRSNVRSLLFNVIDPDNLLLPHDISFIFDTFKLVKVLDLESLNIGGVFPSEVQFLIHLRYFAAQMGGSSIPSSIAKLWNLETFVLRGLGVEVVLPSSLLKMVKLRHVHVNHSASFSFLDNMGESHANSQLDNLETLSTVHLSYGEDTEVILRKMLKLRKLSCIFSGKFGYSEIVKGRCVLFPNLEFLCHLESLKLVSNNYPAKLPHVFSFPSSLRKLSLSKFRLPWSQFSAIGKLPNLEILKLLCRAFEGDEWEVKDLKFPGLKYLELDDLNIGQWSINEDAFPVLACLVLTKCKKLKEIPSYFEDAISLRNIEVNWCSRSLANSAQEIQTMQHDDYQNHALTLTILPHDFAKPSSP